jgi:ferrous iron transport protein B
MHREGIRQGEGVIFSLICRYIFVALASAEEEAARDFICFGGADAVIVVCDATCLERNLNLVLQTLEITDKVVVCVNLMDEAKKKGIEINLALLSERLGVPVVGTNARSNKGLEELIFKTEEVILQQQKRQTAQARYVVPIEQVAERLRPVIESATKTEINSRWIALKLLEGNEALIKTMSEKLNIDFNLNNEIAYCFKDINADFERYGLTPQRLRDKLAIGIINEAERICEGVVNFEKGTAAPLTKSLTIYLQAGFSAYPS